MNLDRNYFRDTFNQALHDRATGRDDGPPRARQMPLERVPDTRTPEQRARDSAKLRRSLDPDGARAAWPHPPLPMPDDDGDDFDADDEVPATDVLHDAGIACDATSDQETDRRPVGEPERASDGFSGDGTREIRDHDRTATPDQCPAQLIPTEPEFKLEYRP